MDRIAVHRANESGRDAEGTVGWSSLQGFTKALNPVAQFRQRHNADEHPILIHLGRFAVAPGLSLPLLGCDDDNRLLVTFGIKRKG